jgi:2-polyprenyl-6-methoxyphenol hydroxylase-like FAD-dependent oxidoreductase
MTEHAVLIAGGGPTGLMLGGELALAGVDVAIVEQRTSHDVVGSRAAGMTPRTLEVLDQRGIAARCLSQGITGQAGHFSAIFFDVSDFPTRHNYGLGLWHYRTERILADWAAGLGVRVYGGQQVRGFAQDDTGVDIELSADASLRAAYLVGCDGGRSLIRKTTGIEFPGWDPSTSCLIADVEMTEEPEWGIHRDRGVLHVISKLEEGPVRVLVTEPQVGRTG